MQPKNVGTASKNFIHHFKISFLPRKKPNSKIKHYFHFNQREDRILGVYFMRARRQVDVFFSYRILFLIFFLIFIFQSKEGYFSP